MPILNYSTDVPADRTVAEIQKMLTKHGARQILIQNDDQGTIVGLAFQIITPDGLMGFKLPVKADAVLKVLAKQRDKARSSGTRFRAQVNEEQAYRVAWRILKDWLEAQMALLETEMVTLDQVFLPYAVTRLGNTLYQEMKESGHLLLTSGN